MHSNMHIFIPAYSCVTQLSHVLAKLSAATIVVETRSMDKPLTVASEGFANIKDCKVTLFQNDYLHQWIKRKYLFPPRLAN